MSRLETLLAMIEEEAPDAFTAYAIACEYAALTDLAQAEHWFQRTLQLDADYVAAYQQLGIAYMNAGQPDHAEKVLRQGLDAAGRKKDFHTQDEIEALLDQLR